MIRIMVVGSKEYTDIEERLQAREGFDFDLVAAVDARAKELGQPRPVWENPNAGLMAVDFAAIQDVVKQLDPIMAAQLEEEGFAC